MIARGFKPVAWVAAVALPAIGCYMLSLKVAAERAELANVETRILAARQDIRTLQTELGTRGRLQQLEQWNADVLALAAPVSRQFVGGSVSLARFDTRTPAYAPEGQVQVAAAQAPRVVNPTELAPRQASLERPQPAAPEPVVPTVRRASLTEERPASVTPAAPTVRRTALTQQRPAVPARTTPATPVPRRASVATADQGKAGPQPQRRTTATPAAPRTERSRPLISAETERTLARRARSERN